MKNTIILSPDKETSERLRVLINILFPEVDVFCVLGLCVEFREMSYGFAPKLLCGFERE
jgi:hypothetical protein